MGKLPFDPRLGAVANELDEHVAGLRRSFDVALDGRLSARFRSAVLHHLSTDVAFGQTASYATLGRLAGNPRAVRAVGTACATNTLPVVVPCHRVVRTDGRIGGYLGGPDATRALLTLEAA